MLDSPLKKNKHSYPIDFTTKKKQITKEPVIKYDKIQLDEDNPQQIRLQKKKSLGMSSSSISELFIQTNKKPQNKHHFQFFEANQALNQSSNAPQSHKQSSIFFQGDLSLQQIQEPLKSIRKINHRIVVDEAKLKNPRIQFNQEKTIATTDKTIETITPKKTQKPSKAPQIGAIKHQNFGYFQQFENQKQSPLVPQKPFYLVHKNTKRTSILQKLNLHKITQKSQPSEYQSFTNSQITCGNKTFRPETYTYVNKLMGSEKNFQSQQKVRRSNSSFDSGNKKHQKIIYVNNDNLGNLSFNLPNLEMKNSGIRFNKNVSSEQQGNLKSRFKDLPHYLLSNTKSSFFQNQSSKPGLEATQINKLKAQINMLARSRFRNKESEQQKVQSHTDRQFTFQDQQKKQSVIKHSTPNLLPKKPTKKLQITYHVPLANLKRLCRTYLTSPTSYHIAFKVPKIFTQNRLFSRTQPKQSLHQNSLLLFQSLRINPKDMIIKRYSNCIMFICGHVVVMWYYSGRRYLGGWQYEYLDEGAKHGLGLQWQPDSYIYYGEFRNNKRHGLGALKEGPERLQVGYWVKGKYVGTKWREESQAIDEEQGQEGQNDPEEEAPLDEYNDEEQECDYLD